LSLPPALGDLLASHPRSGEDLKLGRLAVPFYPPTGWEGAIHWERTIEQGVKAGREELDAVTIARLVTIRMSWRLAGALQL